MFLIYRVTQSSSTKIKFEYFLSNSNNRADFFANGIDMFHVYIQKNPPR